MAYLNGKGVELKLSKKTTPQDETFYLNPQLNQAAGGIGDDVYSFWRLDATITELAGQGIDTVEMHAWDPAAMGGSYTLPSHVENLLLTADNKDNGDVNEGYGNELNNFLRAAPVGSFLDGKGGDDVLEGDIGADIFQVSLGNGSDAIYSFTPGYDTISLAGYDFTSYEQISDRAQDTGFGDVSISLPGGEHLIIRGIEKWRLDAADFGLALSPPPIPAGWQRLDGKTGTNANGWEINVNPFRLDSGQWSNNSIVFNPNDVTGGTIFHWKMDHIMNAGIRAYPFVGLGAYPGYANSSDYNQVFPVRVDQMKSFEVDYSVLLSGNAGGHNVAFDAWFTSTPAGGLSDVTTELMVWVHKGGVIPYGTDQGFDYNDGTFSADVFVQKNAGGKTYIAIVAKQDFLVGTIDIVSITNFLQSKSLMLSTEYLKGVEFGPELVYGSGSMILNNLDATLVRHSVTYDIETQMTGSGSVAIHHGIENAGSDAMKGTGTVGRDIYYVGVGDTVEEGVGAGLDEVRTSLGSPTDFSDFSKVYLLPANVELLTGLATSGQGVQANALDNLISMSGGGDLIMLGNGGNDRVSGNGGDDFIHFGGAFTNGDSADGGAGNDTLALLGNYTVTFDADDLVSIEKLAVHSSKSYSNPWNYNLTMVDANVSANTWMTVVAHEMLGNETLRFNGAAELDGRFNVRGGTGYDAITGGAGDDRIWGNAGGDALKGGAGKDVFEYQTIGDSYLDLDGTTSHRDVMLDFTGGDLIDLSQVDANAALDGNQGFAFVSGTAFTGLGQVIAVWNEGNWLIQANTQGSLAADLSIVVVASSNFGWDAADFVL